MRDDFTKIVKEEVAKKVGYLCSKPDCQAPTSGPQLDQATGYKVGEIRGAFTINQKLNVRFKFSGQ